MTRAGALDIASQIAEGFAGHPSVVAVVLGGSVARGDADASSDLDIFVFCAEHLSRPERAAVVNGVRGHGWRTHSKPDHGILRDCFRTVEHRVDIEQVLVPHYERTLDEVMGQLSTDRAKQSLLGGLLDSIALYDTGAVDAWKTRIRAYPDGLQRKIIEEQLEIAPLWIPRIYAENRGDQLFLTTAMCAAGNQVLDILHGLNRWYLPGEYKRVPARLARMPIAPHRIADRFSAVFRAASPRTSRDLEGIVLEVLDLVEQYCPELDVAHARTEFTSDTDTD